jgi:glutamate 5-kinase
MAALVEQVARLHHRGLGLLIVSSGAIAAGRHKLGLARKRRDIPFKQVLASVGQSSLMHAYDQFFAGHGITVAQALLTKADLSDRAGYLNARNTLLALLELRVVCIVNENDVVAIDEIQGARFGDNDNLSAMVANLVDADLLLILSDIPGLYSADPHRDPGARLIRRVDSVDAEVERLAGKVGSRRGTGGMVTKIEAVRLATASGVTVVIADGREPDVLIRLAAGEPVGTLFSPTVGKMESRKRWMLSGLSSKGRVVVDGGAVAALKRQKRSLLPTGVTEVEGDFYRGDAIDIVDPRGNRVGCGISNYSADDVAIIKGARSDRIDALLGYEYGAEIIHRNNLVVL